MGFLAAIIFVAALWFSNAAHAATRFYFPTTEAADVSPSFQTGWEDTTEAERRELRDTKGTDAITIGQVVDIADDTANDELDRQFVSNPMESGIVFTSGVTTVSMNLMTREYATTDDVNQCIIGVRVMSQDGGTLRTTLLAVANYGSTLEFISNVTHRNHTCANGDTITSTYTTVAGDRIVLEVGYKTDGAETTPQASAKWGDNATALPANDTQTTDGAGWFELSNTISFQTGSTTQRAYLFQNDDGGANADNAASSTTRTGAATSTAITDLKQGERMVVRFQVDNETTIAGTTTKAFRLQWQNQTDDSSSWYDLSGVGTTTVVAATSDRINAALSEYGAPATRGRRLPIPSRWLTTSCAGGVGHWTQLGNSRAVSGSVAALAKLNSTDVAFIDFANDLLRTYRFDGTNWAQVGNSLAVSNVAVPALAALNSTDVAFIDETNDQLRTYRFDGTNWAQVGNSLAVSTVGNPALAALNSTDVAFIDATNNQLRTYRFDGTDWTQVGNSLAVSAFSNATLAALNSTDVAFIDDTNDQLRTYRFDGTNWAQVGNSLALSTVGSSALAALNSTDVAFIDATNDQLRTYRFGYEGTFTPGEFVAGSGTSTPIALGPGQCTELAYVIDTSGAKLGKTYRLRLIDGTNSKDFTQSSGGTYSVYPTFTIESAKTLEYSKGAYGATTTIAMDGAGFDGGQYASLAIGPNGLPYVSHYDATLLDLRLARCLNTTCASTTSIPLDGSGFDGGTHSSMVFDSNGYPSVSHAHLTGVDRLDLARCLNAACTSTTSRSVDSQATREMGDWSSHSIGPDGNSLIAHQEFNHNDLRLTRCLNKECSATTSVDLYLGECNPSCSGVPRHISLALAQDGNLRVVMNRDNTDIAFAYCNDLACSSKDKMLLGYTGAYTSQAIGSDGKPIIAYQSNADLYVIRCADSTCSSSTQIAVDGAGYDGGRFASIAIALDGNPLIAHANFDAGDLYLARCLNPTCTSTTSVAVDGNGFLGGEDASLAIGLDGNPLIAHKNFLVSGSDLYLVKCYAIDCTNSAPPTGTSSLTWTLDNKGYANVASDDSTYDSVAGKNARLVFNLSKGHTNSTDPIHISWNGQVSESLQTTIELYNFTSGVWQGVATNSSPTANSEFSLQKCSAGSMYYGPGNVVWARAMTATTSSNSAQPSLHSQFKTDSISIDFGALQGASISSSHDQQFQNGDPSIPMAALTVRGSVGGGCAISATASNDIRIKIPTGANMEWDTTDAAPSFAGNAIGKVISTVTYPDAFTLLIDVTDDFTAGNTLEIAGLSFKNFTTATGSVQLQIFLEGSGDTTVDATDGRTKRVVPYLGRNPAQRSDGTIEFSGGSYGGTGNQAAGAGEEQGSGGGQSGGGGSQGGGGGRTEE